MDGGGDRGTAGSNKKHTSHERGLTWGVRVGHGRRGEREAMVRGAVATANHTPVGAVEAEYPEWH